MGDSMNIDYKLIGQRIAKERKKAGLTQEMLSEKLLVTVGYISQIERGITRVNLDTLAQISSILGCDIAYLITGTAVKSKSYLNEELGRRVSAMNTQQKKALLKICEAINEL